jgi:hypothetical protein
MATVNKMQTRSNEREASKEGQDSYTSSNYDSGGIDSSENPSGGDTISETPNREHVSWEIPGEKPPEANPGEGSSDDPIWLKLMKRPFFRTADSKGQQSM